LLVLGFAECAAQGKALAAAAGASFELVDVHRFPDGESRVRLPARLPADVVLHRSLDHPNDKLVEVLLTAEGARTVGASNLTLVAPYLCYMRQDAAFTPGEVVSQRIIGRFLADHFDTVVTVDPHLHRVSSLAEAVPAARAVALSAAHAMGEFLATRRRGVLLAGPDAESDQWVRSVAEVAGLDYVVGEKQRLDDRRVDVTLPERDYGGAEVVLVDDVASTGHTLARAAEALAKRGAVRVDVLVTHALFASGAREALEAAGVKEIWSADSISHPSNVIALAPLLAAALG